MIVKQKDFMEFLEWKLNDMKSLLCVQNCFHIVVIEMNGSCKIFSPPLADTVCGP